MINIFFGALIFSILCVTLFFEKSIGLSMLLFILPFAYYIIYLLEKNKKIENPKAKILIIPIILLASTYFLFNNSFFNDLNGIVIPILLIFMILGLFNEKLKINLDFIGKILEMFLVPLSFIGETFEKLRNCLEDKLKINIDSKKEAKIKKVAKSILITLPIVLVIIILLSSADEIFGDIFVDMFWDMMKAISNIKMSTAIFKIILTICAFIYLLCFFDYISARYEKDEKISTQNENIKDNYTIKMILTVLNIIYLVFCYIQIKSLFMRNVDIDYAQYARQGFFQLMIVSVINLATILIAKNSGKSKYINIMSVIMIGFTFIILISSAVRMYFYESAYGYTILRLLVYIALFTEAVMLIPTIFYALDKPINIAKTYFTIILSAYVITNLVNINNIVAQKNVDRYFATEKLDIYYLKYEIGIDAIPAMSEILETEEAVGQNEVHFEIREYINNEISELESEEFDIREFNISKMKIKNINQ